MGWYPYCGACDCKDVGPPPIFEVCDFCIDDEKPPMLCLTFRDVTNGANDCCEPNMKDRTFWLPHLPPDSATCPVTTLDGKDVSIADCCVWECTNLLFHSDATRAAVCSGGSPAEFEVINAWLVETVDGHIYLLVTLGHSFAPVIYDVFWFKDLGAGPVDCTSWIAEVLTYDSGTLTGCSIGTSTIEVTGRNIAIESWMCCQTDFEQYNCYAGSRPQTVSITLSGATGGCASPVFACDDCTDFNGTYVLSMDGDAPGGGCDFVADLDTPVCEYQRVRLTGDSGGAGIAWIFTFENPTAAGILGGLGAVEFSGFEEQLLVVPDCKTWTNITWTGKSDLSTTCAIADSSGDLCNGNITDGSITDNVRLVFNALKVEECATGPP